MLCGDLLYKKNNLYLLINIISATNWMSVLYNMPEFLSMIHNRSKPLVMTDDIRGLLIVTNELLDLKPSPFICILWEGL